MAYRSSVHESTGFSLYMFGEECTLPIDVGLPWQEPDPITSPYAAWVCDGFALEVAYDQVRRHSGQAVQCQKRLYDRRAVRRLFAVGIGSCVITPLQRSANWILLGLVRILLCLYSPPPSQLTSSKPRTGPAPSPPPPTPGEGFAMRPDVAWCISTTFTRTHFLTRHSKGGGGGVLPRLLSFVGRAMAIAQLTQLHISIPASGAPPGQVPAECFPGGTSSQELTSPRRVSFASNFTVFGDAPPLVHSPDIIVHEPLRPEIVEEDDMDTGGAMTDTLAPIIPPAPGFRKFSWPREEWKVDGDPSLFNLTKELPGWFPWSSRVLPVDLPLSPIVPDSLDDSVIANMGSSREKSNTRSEVVVVPPVGDVEVLADSPLPTNEGLLADLLLAPIATRSQGVTLGSQ